VEDPRLIRRLFQIVALVTASLTLTLLVFEGGLRLLGYRPIYEVYSRPSQFWQYDPLLGWSHQPGAEGMFIGPRPWPIEFETRVKINSIGLRGPEIPARDAADPRLLFLGDSMVAAFEVAYDETFVSLVARDLEARRGASVQAINAGVRGYGTDQSLLYFRERGRHLQPDVVVFVHASNDSRNNRTVHRMRRPFGKPAFVLGADGSLELAGAPVPSYPICSQYGIGADGGIARSDSTTTRFMCRAQMQAFDRSALFTFVTLRVPWDPAMLARLYRLGQGTEVGGEPGRKKPGWELTTALVRQLAREVRSSGAGFVLASEEVDQRSLDMPALAEDDIEFVDLIEVVKIAPGEVQFVNDSHFNVKGHRLAADLLVPAVERELARRATGPKGPPGGHGIGAGG
jgi:hypothetical protein